MFFLLNKTTFTRICSFYRRNAPIQKKKIAKKHTTYYKTNYLCTAKARKDAGVVDRAALEMR